MAAIVKPIEAKAIHLIQSGQVIVDLCSVVKELVENSLDAEANAIEVRFKNNGLDEIEVQDNGTGIASANYEAIALKHHTSKLATYDDLTSLSTFGFRGEALSSLCALSNFTVVTAQAEEAPKGNRLEFEASGKLKAKSIVACQKGTTVSVSDLFQNLPVRRKELGKNIKREYGKVIGLLHAYTCISTGVKFTVKNTMSKGKSMTVFATKANATTRENIANVYGAKTLSALAQLDLTLDFEASLNSADRAESRANKVVVKGHISKPVFGEGRQTPDRQMFFVNGRPCGLTQIAKAINEVYRSFNVSQSPFIFADFQMDTNAYDVNVSPDKRSIFLHNAVTLIDTLKVELTAMFNDQDQTVPHSKLETPRLPAFKQLSLPRTESIESRTSITPDKSHDPAEDMDSDPGEDTSSSPLQRRPLDLFHDHFRDVASTREEPQNNRSKRAEEESEIIRERRAAKIAEDIMGRADEVDEYNDVQEARVQILKGDQQIEESGEGVHVHVRDFNARMIEQQSRRPTEDESQNNSENVISVSAVSHYSSKHPGVGIVQNAFNRMRPKRIQPETATITIGDKTVTRIIGSQSMKDNCDLYPNVKVGQSEKRSAANQFSQRIGQFSALGTQAIYDLGRIETDDDGEASLLGSDEHEDDTEIASAPRTKFYIATEEHNNTAQVDSDKEEDMSMDENSRTREEGRVAELISMAEMAASKAEKEQLRRLNHAMKSGLSKESTVSLELTLELPIHSITNQTRILQRTINFNRSNTYEAIHELADSNAEERLSLTVSKSDFAGMHVVGQFNLGFILAVRSGQHEVNKHNTTARNHDELFIIDQHASDEKFNFERLQSETVVGSQRMVRPITLDLTAVEEEILIDNDEALEKNGFLIEVDTSGKQVVGQRCQLVSLPMSKEVAFNTKDLDELIHLLSETPMLSDSSFVPRPTKVRKMFAMRACRSSIMIGKTLSKKQMSTVLRHMGSIEKPWNCPHGRPTMRHLASLDSLDSILWKEGQGVFTGSDTELKPAGSDVWKAFME